MIVTGYEKMDEEIVKWAVKSGFKDRIVSIDLETKVTAGNFLSGETLLSASISRRLGDMKTDVIVLEEESIRGETELLSKLNELLLQVRPVIVVGFNHRGYDNVLLTTKKRLLAKPGFWGIKDTLERAHMLDVMHAARFAIAEHDGSSPKILPLSKVLQHPMFASLPLKQTKSLVSGDGDKGLQIYNLWKNDRETFMQYAEGDAHDTYLVFEEIFKTSIR